MQVDSLQGFDFPTHIRFPAGVGKDIGDGVGGLGIHASFIYIVPLRLVARLAMKNHFMRGVLLLRAVLRSPD